MNEMSRDFFTKMNAMQNKIESLQRNYGFTYSFRRKNGFKNFFLFPDDFFSLKSIECVRLDDLEIQLRCLTGNLKKSYLTCYFSNDPYYIFL